MQNSLAGQSRREAGTVAGSATGGPEYLEIYITYPVSFANG